MTNRATAAHWMRQAAACRRSFAATQDRFWAYAARNAVAVARAHRTQGS